jgi:hypothetical protein
MGEVQGLEDDVNTAIVVLESNAEIMTRLRNFYQALVEEAEFPSVERDACRHYVRNFASQMDEIIYEHNMQISRGKAIAKLVADRKQIVGRTLFSVSCCTQLTSMPNSSSTISKARSQCAPRS